MSINSVSLHSFAPTSALRTAANSAAAATRFGAAGQADASGSTTMQAGGSAASIGQLSADVQSFLLQLQGGGSAAAPSTTSANGAGSQAASNAGVDATGTKPASRHHGHRGHHGEGASGVTGSGEPGETDAGGTWTKPVNADAPSGPAGTSNGSTPVGGFARTLAVDIAKALQSYAGGALTAPLAAGHSAGLAAAA